MGFMFQGAYVLFVALLYVLSTSQTYAYGFGVSGGIGLDKWSRSDETYENYDGERHVMNLGFIYDTAVRRNKLFGYRFAFLREQNSSNGGKLDMHGWATTHDFEFGLLRNKKYRIWVGPEFKLSYYNKLTINTNEQIVSSYNGIYNQSGLGDVWAFVVGPAVGLNYHLPNMYSLAFTAAFLVGNYNGDTDYKTTNGNSYGDLHEQTTSLYLTISILFRTNE